MLDTKELPPEAEEQIPSRSRSELVSEFVSVDERLKTLKNQRNELAMALAGIAWENKGESDTGHVAGTGGQRIKVVFGKEYSYETELMMDVMKLVGQEVFDSLFKTKIEFTAQKRALKMFLNTTWPEEAKETAKKIIGDATMVKTKSPYVTIE